jgi:pilus assembly protein CpaE
MELSQQFRDDSSPLNMSWKLGLILETPELSSGIKSALSEIGAAPVMEFSAATSPLEVANAVGRERPDILFVELSRTTKPAAEWMTDARRGEETPLVIAVHPTADPAEMISALRSGASEFICLPVKPAIFEALERLSTLLESRQTATLEQGTVMGFLSAKGGCGATSIACHLGAALRAGAANPGRVLIADLDRQAPGAHHVLRVTPRSNTTAAFESVRRLSTTSWREFVTPGGPVDLLAAPRISPAAIPEQWRVEGLLRFVSRQYRWVLADLGRHLNPANWLFLQNIHELCVVTAPEVLALYQTRSILQTLANRGFEKSHIKLILNRNRATPQDFWVESIEQMFEMNVFAVIPNDYSTLDKAPRDRFEFPADTPFGKAVMKLAGRLTNPGGPGSMRKAA